MRLTTGFVLWVVAAAAATAVGLAAVAAIGTDIFGAGRDPLSQSEVDELLASRTQVPSTSSTTTRTTDAPRFTEQSTATEGGTVIARCTSGGLPEVLSATPAQGYRVDQGEDLEDHPSVVFSSGDREVEVRLRCVNGFPDAEVKIDD